METSDILKSYPIFRRFLEFADYPEIIRVCIANPKTCKPSWVQDILREKHSTFYEFLYSLDQAQLKQYCIDRPDVCRIKAVRDIVE